MNMHDEEDQDGKIEVDQNLPVPMDVTSAKCERVMH